MFKNFQKQPDCVHVSRQMFREAFPASLNKVPIYYYRISCPIASVNISNFTSEAVIRLALPLVRCAL